MKMRKLFAGIVAVAVAATCVSTASLAWNPDTFNAGLIYQTSLYNYRDTIGQTSFFGWDEFEDQCVVGGTATDVEFTTDGTYTVSLQGFDDSMPLNFLKLQTDIASEEYPDVTVTVDTVKINGSVVTLTPPSDTGVLPNNTSENLAKNDDIDQANIDAGFSMQTILVPYTISLVNTWSSVQYISADDAYTNGTIEVTFTVAGLDGTTGDDDDDTTADDDDDTTADDDDDTAADDDDDTAADDDDDTTADDDDDDAGKDSPDTGVEGIAVVAGLAIVAAGAVIVSKKRK